MNKLRISYSLLRLWEQGKKQEAIEYFTKTGAQLEGDAIEQGNAWDQIIQDEINKKGMLPKEFGGLKLEKAFCQEKKVIEFDGFEVVAKPDLVTFTGEAVYEFKTGKFSSGDYANTMQVPLYLFVFDTAKKGIIIHYDQAVDQTDWFLIHKTDKMIEDVKAYILKNGNEIREYFIKQGII